MAGFIYPRALLESWFKLNKMPARLEARGEFDDMSGDDYSATGDSGNADVMDSMGRYGQMVDYSDENTIGYSEAGVDDSFDSIMSRPDMHIEDAGAAEEPPKKRPNGGTTKDRREYGASPEARAKKIAREQFDNEWNVRVNEASRIKESVVAAYEAFPEAMENADVRQRLEELKSGFECDEYAKAPSQIDWENMERLGIAAHDADCVPPGLPENPLTIETLASLAYLSMGKNAYMYILQNPDKLVNLFERDTMAKVAREVNSHIMGTTGGKPRLAGDLYRGYTLDAPDMKAKSNQVRATASRSKAMASDESIDRAEMKLAGYTYPSTKTGSVYAAPYDLVKGVLSVMSDDSMDSRNSAAIARLKAHGLTADKLAAELIFMGNSNFKKKYHVSPTLTKVGDKYIAHSCFITVPKDIETGVTMSRNCAELLRKELGRIRDGRNIKLLKNGTVAEKGVLDDACSDLDRMLSDTKSTMYTFDSPSIAELLHGDYTAQQGKKNSFVDGQLKVVTPPPEPLFGFIQSETGPTVRGDELQHTDYESDDDMSNSAMAKISSGHGAINADADSGNVQFDAVAAYVDTYLRVNDDITPFYGRLGFSKEDIPSEDADHAEKAKFFSSVLEKVSDCFHEFGVESGLTAEGLNISIDITPEDRDLVGDSILAVWKYYAKQKAEEIDASESPIKYGIRRQFLWKMLDAMLKWFDTFETGIDSVDAIKRKLKSGDYDNGDLMKLMPSVNLATLVKETIANGAVTEGISSEAGKCSPAEVFAFVKKFLASMAKKHNADVTTAPVINQVFRYIKEKYGSREAIIEAGSDEPPDRSNEPEFYEWCVLRFMASSIFDANGAGKGRLVPPEEVGKAGSADMDVPASVLRKRLRKYEECLASKPAYLNAHAWIRKCGDDTLSPEEYDALRSADFRVMDESPADVSVWIRDEYIKYGDRSEALLLLLSLLYICIALREANYSALGNGDDMMSGIPDIFGKWQPLDELWSEYGQDVVNAIVGYDVGDGGVALDELMCLLGGVPKNMDSVDRDYDSRLGFYGAAGVGLSDDPGIIDRLDSIYDTLRGTSFLRFNEIA